MTEPASFRDCAEAGLRGLATWYDPATGLWDGTGWWNCANALTAVAQYIQRTGDGRHRDVIETTFNAGQDRHPGFINDYFDDTAWWGLAWLDAYDLTGETRYLSTARAIFAACTGGWDDRFGGGLWWNTERAYKNAITTELFLSLAARLHQRVPDDEGPDSYRDWAERAWKWFRHSGLIGSRGLVNDGLTPDGGNNGGTTWTCNQGVILGGLTALHEISGDSGLLDQAHAIAGAALAHLTTAPPAGPRGVLAEPCEAGLDSNDGGAGCNGDQSQFKGIFVRNLYELYQVAGRPSYRRFILDNARSIWVSDRDGDRFGLRWTGPFDRADASRQSSALDAFNAALAVEARAIQS